MKLVILNLTNQTVHYLSHPLSEVFYLPRPRGRREMAFSPPTWLRRNGFLSSHMAQEWGSFLLKCMDLSSLLVSTKMEIFIAHEFDISNHKTHKC